MATLTNTSCTVVSNFSTSETMIDHVLNQSQIKLQKITSNSPYTTVVDTIRNSAGVIFLINREESFIDFALGLCEGMGKAYITFVKENTKYSEFVERTNPQRLTSKNSELVNLVIRDFIRGITSKKTKGINRVRRRGDLTANQVSQYLRDLQEVRLKGSGLEYEQFITRLFKELSYTTIPTRHNDIGVDLVVYASDRSTEGHNAIIAIQLKMFNRYRMDIVRESTEKMTKHLDVKDLDLAVLLYLDKEQTQAPATSVINNVLIANIEDFIRELRGNSLYNYVNEALSSHTQDGE